MLKPTIINYYEYYLQNLHKGFDTVLLAKHNDKFYRVQEHIGLVVDLEEQQYENGIKKMSKLKIRFLGGEIFETMAYVDDNIGIYNIVSIYGIFVRNGTTKELYCKAGITRTFGKLTDISKISLKNLYKFGYAELTRAELSTIFPETLQNIMELEAGRLWIYVGNDIVSIEDNFKKVHNEEGIEDIDTTISDQIVIDRDTGTAFVQ